MKRLFLLVAFSATLGLAIAGCDSVLDTEPIGIEVIENQLATPGGSILFVNSIYQPLPVLYGSFFAPMANLLESGTDDGWPRAQDIEDLKSRNIDASQGPLAGVWGRHFDGISRINIFLARVDNIDYTGREDLRDQLRGEALFMRAFYYFNLVRLFGEAPIYTEEVLSIPEAQKPRSSVEEVYAQIKADLNEAVPLLPAEYTGGAAGSERGRITSGAARTMLGKVHLTLEEWQETLGVLVLDSLGEYSLHPNYVDNFYGLVQSTGNENRVEAIFEVQFTSEGPGGLNSLIRVTFVPRGRRNGQGRILPTDNQYERAIDGAYGPNAFVQAIDTSDARHDVILSKYGFQESQTGSYPGPEFFVYKWWSDTNGNEIPFNIPLFRYAEVLLMRAEALIELGRPAEAIPLINQVRTRAGVEPLGTDLSIDAAREAVRYERRIEFAFEHKRLFDLNRWGILEQEVEKQGVEIDDAKVTTHPITGEPQVLYPIPNSELQRNPNATQNAGY